MRHSTSPPASTRRPRRTTIQIRVSGVISAGQADADERGDDRQGVSRNRSITLKAPRSGRPLEHEPSMADAGYSAETQNHFLVDVEDGDQQGDAAGRLSSANRRTRSIGSARNATSAGHETHPAARWAKALVSSS